MSGWRYFATRLHGDGTESLLADDLPLSDVSLRDELSGPGGITATITPEHARLKGPDGLPVLRAWSSAIYAESDGIIRAGGILTEPTIEGPDLRLDAVGFTGYLSGMPYMGSYSVLSTDPLDIVRHVWAHVQGFDQGDLGLSVDDSTSTVRVGKPEDPKLTLQKQRLADWEEVLKEREWELGTFEADVVKYTKAAFAGAGMGTGGRIIVQKTAPTGDKRSKKNLWIEGSKADGLMDAQTWTGSKWVPVGNSKLPAIYAAAWNLWDAEDAVKLGKKDVAEVKKKRNESKSKVSDLRDGEAKPFTMSWWETDDLARVVDDLAAETPFEYRVTHAWRGDTITHRLELAAPTLGRRLHDLRFAVGENVRTLPGLTFGGDEYADAALVLGAGEGRKMVRGTWNLRTDRLRRVAVVEAKDLSKADAAVSLAEREVRARTGTAELADTLAVLDHPHAPIGSYRPGDEILVITPEGWTGELRAWYRILSVETTPDARTATLTVRRSEKVA